MIFKYIQLLKACKLLQKTSNIFGFFLNIFNLGSSNVTIRKNVCCFTSVIWIFIFDAIQNYSKIMENKIIEVKKIVQLQIQFNVIVEAAR